MGICDNRRHVAYTDKGLLICDDIKCCGRRPGATAVDHPIALISEHKQTGRGLYHALDRSKNTRDDCSLNRIVGLGLKRCIVVEITPRLRHIKLLWRTKRPCKHKPLLIEPCG